jgi:hypothetical protein
VRGCVLLGVRGEAPRMSGTALLFALLLLPTGLYFGFVLDGWLVANVLYCLGAVWSGYALYRAGVEEALEGRDK